MKLTAENFFTNFFLLNHKDEKLDEGDQGAALAYSVAIGILSLGTVHLVCALIKWCITEGDKGDKNTHTTDRVAREVLINPSLQEPKTGPDPKIEVQDPPPGDKSKSPAKFEEVKQTKEPSVEEPEPIEIPTHQGIFIKHLAKDFAPVSESAAKKYLSEKGKPGDYIVIDKDTERWNAIYYMNESHEIKLLNTFHYGNEFYASLKEYSCVDSLNKLNFLKNPVHPKVSLSAKDKMRFQGAIKDFYYLRLVQLLRIAKKNECEVQEFIGLDTPLDLQGLIDWLEKLPNQAKREEIVSSIFPFFAKAYGHVFGINGEVVIDSVPIKLEGLFSRLGKTLVASFQKDHIQKTALLSAEEKTDFELFIQNNCSYQADVYEPLDNVAQKIYDDVLKGNVVSIGSGYSSDGGGHSINITLSKEFICYTNRGDRLGPVPGTYIWKIKDIDKLKPETIKKIFQQESKDERVLLEVIANGMSEGLLEGAEKQKFQKFSEQRVGNCSFINNVTNSWATALIYEYRKTGDYEKATQFASAFYKELRIQNKATMMDYWRRLQNILPEERKKDHFVIFRTLNRLIFQKTLTLKKTGKKNSLLWEEKHKKLCQTAHEMMRESSVLLKEVFLPQSIVPRMESDFSKTAIGTFGCFYYRGEDFYQYKVLINHNNEAIREVFIGLSNKSQLTIKIFYKDKEYPQYVHKELETIGDLVSAVKEACKVDLQFIL